MVQAEAAVDGRDLPNRHYSHAVGMRDRWKGDKRVGVPTAALAHRSLPVGRRPTQNPERERGAAVEIGRGPGSGDQVRSSRLAVVDCSRGPSLTLRVLAPSRLVGLPVGHRPTQNPERER